MRILGLMSGTSMDGVDAALVDIEGGLDSYGIEVRAYLTKPYPQALGRALARVLPPNAGSVRDVCALDFAVGEAFAAAALELIGQSGLDPASIDAIGSHGQTIYHLPSGDGGEPFVPSTLQIGQPAVISARTGITCVGDFRVADVAVGGQGAPLVPFADFALLRDPSEYRVALNIGGIANVTQLPPGCTAAAVRAWDTGPGNVMIDAAARIATADRLTCDVDGALAARGKVLPALLAWLLSHPYYRREPPKSCGRETFGGNYVREAWQRGLASGGEARDVVATLTALTARTIAESIPRGCQRVIVSGGGTRNPTLLAQLRSEFITHGRKQLPVQLSDAFGIPSDAKEAVLFALLAFEALHLRTNNMPACTGAQRPVIMGQIAVGANVAGLVEVLCGSARHAG